MPAGRPPKPTALKELAGNPGKRPAAPTEPKPAVRLPSPPSYLTGPAKAEWKRLGPKLVALGLVTDLDRAAFAIYCTAYATAKEAAQHLAAEGRHSLTPEYTDDRGRYHPPRWETSPWDATERSANDVMLKALVHFGLSPSSRSKVSAAAPETKASPLTLLRNRQREGTA